MAGCLGENAARLSQVMVDAMKTIEELAVIQVSLDSGVIDRHSATCRLPNQRRIELIFMKRVPLNGDAQGL
jgi:hypothetical protein